MWYFSWYWFFSGRAFPSHPFPIIFPYKFLATKKTLQKPRTAAEPVEPFLPPLTHLRSLPFPFRFTFLFQTRLVGGIRHWGVVVVVVVSHGKKMEVPGLNQPTTFTIVMFKRFSGFVKLELSFTLFEHVEFKQDNQCLFELKSGRIVIVHQPWFPGNKASCWGGSPTTPPFGVRLCEIAIIWVDIWYSDIEGNIPSSRVRQYGTNIQHWQKNPVQHSSSAPHFFQEMPGICTIFWRFSCAAGWKQVAEDLVHQLQGDGSLGWQFFFQPQQCGAYLKPWYSHNAKGVF